MLWKVMLRSQKCLLHPMGHNRPRQWQRAQIVWLDNGLKFPISSSDFWTNWLSTLPLDNWHLPCRLRIHVDHQNILLVSNNNGGWCLRFLSTFVLLTKYWFDYVIYVLWCIKRFTTIYCSSTSSVNIHS